MWATQRSSCASGPKLRRSPRGFRYTRDVSRPPMLLARCTPRSPDKTATSALFVLQLLRYPRLYQFPQQSCRQRLVQGEVDRSSGSDVAPEFFFEGGDYGRGREKTAMIRKRGVPQQRTMVFERGNFVADRFGGVRRNGGTNGRAHLMQGAARGFGDAREVFVDIPRSGAGDFRGLIFYTGG